MKAREALALRPALDVVLRATRARSHPLVLVDGPSGAGKSTFAAALVAAWPGRPPRLVRVDEAIPGWRGLRRGAAALGPRLVRPHGADLVGALDRWDWHADRRGAVERVPPGRPLVLEGCGAFLAGAEATDAVRVWLDAPYETRRERALERDAGAFDEFWASWESDWRRYRRQSGADRRPAIRVRLGA
ncbi:AAA family ATPase [Agromyces luteolus]|uniref:ATP-binding protein n=1 Tax=Agromyces luteolus TaxID=88373 RepID=A0A7C9LG54_9MICO|nr:ATP-binding protein [Agromyces luteolus]MUN08450.1 ATP-binding protein [Agromyces luteolus]